MAAPDGEIALTRTELYHRVWATPVVRLAREFGISDVALARLCRRRHIPRPSRGYWARLASGQTPPRTPLPEPVSGDLRPVRLQRRAGGPETPRAVTPAPQRAGDTGLHPIAERIRRSLLLSKPLACGRVQVRQSGLPVVLASARQATKVAELVHELVSASARSAIDLVAVNGSANTLEFRRRENAAQLFIEEELRAPAATQPHRPPVPSGRLTVRLVVQWQQAHDTPAASLVESVLSGMERVLV